MGPKKVLRTSGNYDELCGAGHITEREPRGADHVLDVSPLVEPLGIEIRGRRDVLLISVDDNYGRARSCFG